MKGLNVVVLLCFVLTIGACCSKKGACPVLQFSSFELRSFDTADVKDSVNVIRYKANSNFAVVLDTTFLKGEPTNEAYVFKVTTQDLSIDYDYGVQVVKLKKLYKISSYTGEKIACGKCFMRANNQFGYQLNGYSVNNHPMDYSGIIVITK